MSKKLRTAMLIITATCLTLFVSCDIPVTPDPTMEPTIPDSGSIDTDDAYIIPDASWTCGMPEGIAPPSSGTLVFSATLPIQKPLDVGETQYGDRVVRPTRAAQFTGERISGQILNGALELELTLPSGAVELESRYVLRTNDRTLIYMHNCGVADGDDVRFVPDFEAPRTSRYAWLNQGTFVGTHSIKSDGVHIAVYEVTGSRNASAPAIRTPSDNNLEQQDYTCDGPVSTRKGSKVLEARVGIGSFLTVGASKYGSRNIIPITGGTFEGQRIKGSVNPGGADYQLNSDSGFMLEAVYTLQTDDGETIIVRNCGPGTTTAPHFEARVNGPYAWLNDETFVGTVTPSVGFVIIRVFETN